MPQVFAKLGGKTENVMELIDKVKKALIDSGFPLEMRMAQILKDDGWAINVGSRYVDFETEVLREIDITASKSINGIEVHLVIECKKSDNKQLVLYAPTHNRHSMLFLPPFRVFPQVKLNNKGFQDIWDELPLFDHSVPLSNNIIFTKGDKVEQNNDSFFASLNGMIKKSIEIGSDGYIETNFRMMFFYLLIYDGVMYQVSNNSTDDFTLTETKYGQYEFPYRFRFPAGASSSHEDIIKTSRLFGLRNVIEIMSPTHLPDYLLEIQQALLNIPKRTFRGWGQSMESYANQYLKEGKKSSKSGNKPNSKKIQKSAKANSQY